MAKDDDDDLDLPEAPPIQMITETFSQIIVKQNENKDTDTEKKDKK